jgi:uncharacterized DUF497 family protein
MTRIAADLPGAARQAQVIGRIGGTIWSAFTTTREGRVRIISVRRARDEEEELYLGR